MEQFLSIAPLNLIAFFIAFICSFLIGFERQWSGKPAGIRTSMLICIGAYIFVSLARYYHPEEGAVRVLGQIVTGVGFLGAGVMLTRNGSVIGVTSAAIIWILAAIGSLIGFGNYGAAILVAFMTLFVLVVLNYLENKFEFLRKGVHRKSKEDQKT